MAEATTQAPPAIGTFCWNELMTRDATKAKQFYTQLFGWKTDQMDMGPAGTYTMYVNGGQHVGGMMALTGPETQDVPPHWLAYVSVTNVDEATKKAQKLGASVCVPPTDIPNNIGRFSIITDPTGASLGLYQSAGS
jgi:hypothetical protein